MLYIFFIRYQTKKSVYHTCPVFTPTQFFVFFYISSGDYLLVCMLLTSFTHYECLVFSISMEYSVYGTNQWCSGMKCSSSGQLREKKLEPFYFTVDLALKWAFGWPVRGTSWPPMAGTLGWKPCPRYRSMSDCSQSLCALCSIHWCALDASLCEMQRLSCYDHYTQIQAWEGMKGSTESYHIAGRRNFSIFNN